MIEQIGPFEVLREIGRGGMGVVYLARDTRLGRDVAIKALPEHLATDPARLERFEREARTLAGLTHPNVAGIYGVEEQDGAKYLVLEYVDGETLADLLDRGPLSVDEAVEYAVQIAAGVEAAHEAGVVHRDLKPANIKVTSDGIAKVLDFGLARSDESGSSSGGLDTPTMTTPHQHSPTIEGAILGTAAYMSPEQARGRRVDKRTDVWSFGVVLYEMLIGSSPFRGETATDSIGAVLHKDLELDRLPAATPANVRRVLERCLERDRHERYRDIGDVRIELRRADASLPASEVARRSSKLPLVVVGLAGVVLACVVGVVTWISLSEDSEEVGGAVRKFDVAQIEWGDEPWRTSPVISPDGRRIAYIADGRIFIRSLDSFEATPVAESEGALSVFWSADSEDIGFRTRDGIYTIRGLRGGRTRVTDRRTQFAQQWLGDGRIVTSIDDDEIDGLVAFPDLGGDPTAIIETDPEITLGYHNFVVIPGTEVVVYLERLRDGGLPIMAFDGERAVKLADFEDTFTTQIAWSPTGHVLFTRGQGALRELWAVAFSAQDMEREGEPFLVMSNIMHPSVSGDGTLAVLRGTVFFPEGELGWIEEDGSFERITQTEETVFFPVLSPDGSLMAFSSGPSQDDCDVWVHDFERGFNRRITNDSGVLIASKWSPDGSEIMVMALDPNALEISTRFYAADGRGETRARIEGAVLGADPAWESAALAKLTGDLIFANTVEMISLDDPGVVLDEIPVPSIGITSSGDAISPDGEHMLYVSGVSGRLEVYCVAWPSGEGVEQVSIDGGRTPVWSPDGSRVLFAGLDPTDSEKFLVDVTRDPEISFSRPRAVFEAGVDASKFLTISESRDGRYIGVRLNDEDADRDPFFISVIENWYEPFREREDQGSR